MTVSSRLLRSLCVNHLTMVIYVNYRNSKGRHMSHRVWLLKPRQAKKDRRRELRGKRFVRRNALLKTNKYKAFKEVERPVQRSFDVRRTGRAAKVPPCALLSGSPYALQYHTEDINHLNESYRDRATPLQE